MSSQPKIWRNVILFTSIILVLCFAAAFFLLSDCIVIDPRVHQLTRENWYWFLDEWVPPVYWNDHLAAIQNSVSLINSFYLLAVGVFLIYIGVHRDLFRTEVRWLVLSVVLVVLASVGIHYFVKYTVDFYYPYMYFFSNLLYAAVMIFFALRFRPPQQKQQTPQT